MMKWTVGDIPPQNGRLAVVTGANSGIGWYTALELARAGAAVILAARSEEKALDAVARIRKQLPNADVRPEVLDLASLASVRRFAARVGAEAKLDLLINNAGVMKIPRREVTEDGFERQFATNFLGHFALTSLLMPALLRATAPRVTTVSSIAAKLGLKRIRFEDLQWERSYDPWAVYCQTKLADLMFALELSRRCTAGNTSVLSNAAHPGLSRTNIHNAGPGKPQGIAREMIGRIISQDAFHGALPTLRAATEINAAPGGYYGPDGLFQFRGNPVSISIPKAAQDEAPARKLWDIAERLTRTRFFV
ncbi:MAG TPA: oxidoreductase [Silvibacterium sp.]|nr:oxidoreductase [Silvibacterium sp.]